MMIGPYVHIMIYGDDVAKNYVQLYFQQGQKQKIDTLLMRLKKQGIVLEDNKGNPSMSALFRWLVDEKLEEMGGYEQVGEVKKTE